MNYIPLQKQGPIFIITKSPNLYRNIKAQITEEIQPLENYENNTVVFDEMLLSKKKAILIYFSLKADTKKVICTIYLKATFKLQKIIFVTFLKLKFCLNNL